MTKTPPIASIAFDLDGLLVNSEDVYEHVGAETLRRRDRQFEDDLRHKMMGRPAAAALQVMIEWHGLDDTVEELAVEGEELFWRFAADELHAMPGAAELLDLLDQRGLPMGIVTSGARPYAERLLEIIGFSERFAWLVTADDITHGKPSPEPYLLAAERFGVEPAQMMVLEDSAAGSRAGVTAGAYTVAVPNRHTAGHDFSGVALVAESLRDPRIIDALAERPRR